MTTTTASYTAHDHRAQAFDTLADDLGYIDGRWVAGTGDSVEHVHPGNGESLGERRLASVDQVDAAVQSAAEAFPSWWALPPARRRDLLLSIAGLIRTESQSLGAIVSAEMGMPLRASVMGVHHAAEWFTHYAGYADKIGGQAPQIGAPGGVLNYTQRVPHGVVAAITPWNGPIIALALKVAPALAAGNTVVLKPSELAPFSSLAFAEAASRAGLPPGVLNVVGAGPDGGARLAEHPAVGLISFTGGNTAGTAVATAAAARHARAVLELGGKSASLIFDDVDVARTAKISLLLGAVQNSGQGCFLPTRVLVHRSIYEPFLDAVSTAATSVRIGDPFDSGTSMGPVVGDAARRRIQGVVSAAVEAGSGRLLSGGGVPAGHDRGSFLEPTVFADVDMSSPLAQQEIFGPVLSVAPFDDTDEAVAIANSTVFGLAGYVWTKDLSRAHRVAAALDAGNVSVNGMASLPPETVFNGWKASGLGVEGGREGLDEFLRTKNINVTL